MAVEVCSWVYVSLCVYGWEIRKEKHKSCTYTQRRMRRKLVKDQFALYGIYCISCKAQHMKRRKCPLYIWLYRGASSYLAEKNKELRHSGHSYLNLWRNIWLGQMLRLVKCYWRKLRKSKLKNSVYTHIHVLRGATFDRKVKSCALKSSHGICDLEKFRLRLFLE